jgi:hypothetical protein
MSFQVLMAGIVEIAVWVLTWYVGSMILLLHVDIDL